MKIIWQMLEQLELIKNNGKDILLSPNDLFNFLLSWNEMASIFLWRGDKIKLNADAKKKILE